MIQDIMTNAFELWGANVNEFAEFVRMGGNSILVSKIGNWFGQSQKSL
jgi:hypothetical protein